MSLFNRYARPARRAIYYAREAALHADSSEINSTHLLSGLLVEQSSRANTLLQLSTLFAEETSRMRALKQFPQPRDIPLSRDGKRIISEAAAEADRMNKYWIDTDHLALAILQEKDSEGSIALANAGLQSDRVRKVILDNSSSREDYGAVPAFWWLARPITRKGKIAAYIYLFFVFILFRALMPTSCGLHR